MNSPSMSRPTAQEYSYRVPSPPHIRVPPPAFIQNGTPDLQLALDLRGTYDSGEVAPSEFLDTVTYGEIVIYSNRMNEWTYAKRRIAQMISPFLYLGPLSAAKDKNFLVEEGITMVLAIRNSQSANTKLLGLHAAQELGLEIASIDVDGNQALIAAFPRGIKAVNLHLRKMYQLKQAHSAHPVAHPAEDGTEIPGKVLVFCETGNERSATMVTAYIMAMYSVDLYRALQIVQAKRFCVAIDDSQRALLSTFEAMLQARRDTNQIQDDDFGTEKVEYPDDEHHTQQAAATSKSTKRRFGDVHQDQSDTDFDGNQGEMDLDRFEQRDGVAPFLN